MGDKRVRLYCGECLDKRGITETLSLGLIMGKCDGCGKELDNHSRYGHVWEGV